MNSRYPPQAATAIRRFAAMLALSTITVLALSIHSLVFYLLG
jgi:hypothetical protein